MTTLLEVQQCCVSYGKVEAVRNVSFAIKPGQIITIIGPNGAGKTTLLNALSGLLPFKGHVLYQGRDLSTLEVEDRVREGLCLVPEKRELFSGMSVADNLVLGGYLRRRDRTAIKRDLGKVYDLFPKLAARRHQATGTLSGGERQMVAVGRALMSNPKLLMLDEPSLGLAPRIVQEIFKIISNLRELGVSILLVEQNAKGALETADYGYVLETSEIALHGHAKDLLTDPRVAATYLGTSVFSEGECSVA